MDEMDELDELDLMNLGLTTYICIRNSNYLLRY